MGPHVKVRKAGNEPASKAQDSALQYQPGFNNQFVTEARPGALPDRAQQPAEAAATASMPS